MDTLPRSFVELENQFMPAYLDLRARRLAAVRPVLMVSGEDVIIRVHDGDLTGTIVVPEIVDALRVVSHVPLTVWLQLAAPGACPDDAPVARLLELVDEAVVDLDRVDLPADARERCQRVLHASRDVLREHDTAAADGLLARLHDDLDALAAVAATAMLDALDDGIRPVIERLTNEQREALVVVNWGTRSAREQAQVAQYLQWLLDIEPDSERFVFAEGKGDLAGATEVLAAHLADVEIGRSFTGDPMGFMHDVLGPATQVMLRERPHPWRRDAASV